MAECTLQSHPRLLVNESELTLLKNNADNDETAQWMYQHLKAKADGYLNIPPASYSLKEVYRLSDETVDGIQRIGCLALMYRMTEDESYAARAYEEMDAICSYPDWNTQHFLDTALILESVAIGYDWLYDWMNDEQRLYIRTAILEKGLNTAQKVYSGELTSPSNTVFWLNSSGNWNSSCNEAVILASLSIAEDFPQYPQTVSMGLKSLSHSLHAFEPDGGWVEGLSYWNTMMTDYAMLFAGLESSLNTDFGYSKIPCLKSSVRFGMDMTGSGGVFNFSDCDNAQTVSSPALMWFGNKYCEPVLCTYQKNTIQKRQSCSVYDFIWYTGAEAAQNTRLDSFYRNIHTVSMRSSSDSDGIFVGIHSGSNAMSHTHLDTGTFVFDALGERWFGDFGRDRSSYTGSDRASLYKLRAEGHNTLVIHSDTVSSDTDSDGLRCVAVDDFEGNILNYPVNTFGDASCRLTQSNGNQFVRLMCNESSGAAKAFFQKEFKNFAGGALNCDVSISFDVCIQNAYSDISPITVRDSEGTELTSVLWLAKNNRIKVMNGAEKVDVGGYEPGRWYGFTLKFKAGSNTVDVYCNNNLIANNFSLTKELSDIAMVRFPIFAKLVTMDIDNLKIYADISEEQLIRAKRNLADQSEYSDCRVTSYISEKDYAEAVTDMTDAYSGYADSVTRKIALYDGRSAVRITDEIKLKQSADIYWFAHTDARIQIEPDGKTAYLSKNGKSIRVDILSADGVFTQMPAASMFIDGQAADGYTKLAIVMEDVSSADFTVDIRPV